MFCHLQVLSAGSVRLFYYVQALCGGSIICRFCLVVLSAAGSICLFYQYLCQQNIVFLRVRVLRRAAMLVHSLPKKSRKGMARNVMYASHTYVRHTYDATGLAKMTATAPCFLRLSNVDFFFFFFNKLDHAMSVVLCLFVVCFSHLSMEPIMIRRLACP